MNFITKYKLISASLYALGFMINSSVKTKYMMKETGVITYSDNFDDSEIPYIRTPNYQIKEAGINLKNTPFINYYSNIFFLPTGLLQIFVLYSGRKFTFHYSTNNNESLAEKITHELYESQQQNIPLYQYIINSKSV